MRLAKGFILMGQIVLDCGSRRSMNTADSGRFTYTYDAGQQNRRVLNPFGERTTFAYDASGRLTTRRLSNGTRTSYSYDAASRRTSVDNLTSGGAAIAKFTYQHDARGNPTSMLESSGDRVTWTYDATSQLLSECRSGTSSYASTFTYDPVGNRTMKNANSVRTTSIYDAANQLRYSQAAAGRTTFQYDAAGNQQIEQPAIGNRTTTTWNYESQPSQYQLPDASRVTLSYNADNRRILKQSSTGTTKFVWDPVLDAYQSELDASNVIQAIYTQPPVQFGQIISQRRGTTSHWYHPDSLGTTRALSDSAQATSDTYLVDAWGNPISSTGSTINSFRWVGNVGYYFDQESGLYYIRARVYQPTIARWISADPLFYALARSGMISISSRDPIGYFSGANQYVFLEDGPVDKVDPSGLKFSYTIHHWTMKQIDAREPGALAATIPILRIVGQDDIREWRETPCCWCAKVFKTREFDFVLETFLPTDGLGTKYTANGWFEIAAHEMRRYKSYKLGYDKYLDPAPAIAKKCGTICFPARWGRKRPITEIRQLGFYFGKGVIPKLH